MANPNRVMARLVHVDSVDPIDGADRIERARVGGWTLVVGKGDFKAGDLAVFYEVDTFLPADDPRYEKFAERGVRQMIVDGAAKNGHVLRTARLRGVYSQGLLMSPQDVLPPSIPEHAYEQMYERKVNLNSLCGVCEYDPIRTTEQGNMDILRKYDPWVAPRTDAERIQNVSEDVFSIIKKTSYFVSVKVDGTSMTMLYDPRYSKVRLFSHNNELGYERGFGKQVYEQAVEQGLVDWVTRSPGLTVQFEACGPKINGNRLGLNAIRLYVFSVWDTDTCRYLNPYALVGDGDSAIMRSLTPRLDIDMNAFDTTLDLIDYVDGLRGNVTDRLDEGVVIHVVGNMKADQSDWFKLSDALGAQMQVKCISRKYLLKAKE